MLCCIQENGMEPQRSNGVTLPYFGIEGEYIHGEYESIET